MFHYRGLKATDRGLNVVDSVTAELLNVLNNYYELYGSQFAKA